MGCDIHAHVEIKLNDKWEHFNSLNIDRCYQLFGRMAGVRHSDEPHINPRGLPDDISAGTRLEYEYMDCDAHTTSWLTADEAIDIQEWYESTGGKSYPPLFGYLCGNDINYLVNQSEVERCGLQDARVVFWFDN